MKRLPTWLQAPVRLAGAVAATLALLLLLGLVWALMTTNGLRTIVGAADQLAGDTFSVERVDGRLFGTMHLENIRSESPAASVAIDNLTFGWTPGWLPALRLHIRTVQVEGITIALHDAPAEEAPPPTESGAFDISLPLSVVVADLGLRDLRITRNGEALPGLDALHLRGWAEGRRVAIEELRVEQPEFGSYRLQARLGLPVGGIRIEELQLEGAGTLRASGAIPLDGSPALDLALDWEDLHWPAGASGDARLATSPRGRLRIAGALDAPEVDGEIRLAPDATIRLDGAWRGTEGFTADIAWKGLVDPMQPQAPLWRSPEGRLRASGLPDDWQAEVTAEAQLRLAGAEGEAGTEGALTEQLDARLNLRANGGLEQARLETLALETLDGRLAASGDVHWAPALKAALDLELNGLDPGRLLADFPGRLNGAGQLQLTMPGDQPDARFQVALQDSSLRDYPLSMQLEGRFRDSTLALQRFRLRSGGSTLTASGRATPPFDLRAELNSPDLAELVPDVAGRADLGARVRGDMATLQVMLDGRLRELEAAGQRIAAIDIDADTALDGATRARVRLRGLQPAGAAEPLLEELRLALDGRIDDHRLQLDATLPQGSSAMTLNGAADIAALQWQGRLETLSLQPTHADIPPLRLREAAPLRLSAEQAALEDFCLDSDNGSAVCLSGEWRDPVLRASYRVERFDFAVLQALLPPGMELDGSATGEGEFALRGSSFEALDAGLDIAEGALRIPQRPELRFGPGRLSADAASGDTLRGELQLAVAGGELTGGLRVATTDAQRLDGNLRLDLPELNFLPLFTTEVREAAGRLRAEADIGGTVTAPEFSARMQLDDGRLQLYTPGLDLRDIRARLDTRDGRQVNLQASARSDEGSLEISGNAALDTDPIRAQLRVQGSDFQAANLPEVQAWISPDLEITVAETIDVTGSIVVPRAVIEPEKFSGGDSGQAPHPDQVIVQENGEVATRGLPINARVTVSLGDEVSLEGYGLETRLGGSITVIEEPNRVTRARGALTLEEGRYDAYGQRLDIRRGRIVFAGGPVTEPGLDLEAVRTPRENILVGIRVRGSIEQPEFQLFSEPAMPQTAQLSWLVLGRAPPDSGSSEGEGDAMAAAALALGLSGGDWIAQRLGSSLGVDEISVGTEDGQSGQEAQLTVGKYIGTRLYVAYGISLFQPGHVFRMRYDIGRGFAIQTETGVESGGDLLYTHER